jgi:hypothetical protein
MHPEREGCRGSNCGPHDRDDHERHRDRRLYEHQDPIVTIASQSRIREPQATIACYRRRTRPGMHRARRVIPRERTSLIKPNGRVPSEIRRRQVGGLAIEEQKPVKGSHSTRGFAKEWPSLDATRRWRRGTLHATPSWGREMRTVRTVTGFALLGGGLVMLALPGPGLLAIGAGLGMLASEFPWAHRLLTNMKSAASRMRPHARR